MTISFGELADNFSQKSIEISLARIFCLIFLLCTNWLLSIAFLGGESNYVLEAGLLGEQELAIVSPGWANRHLKGSGQAINYEGDPTEERLRH